MFVFASAGVQITQRLCSSEYLHNPQILLSEMTSVKQHLLGHFPRLYKCNHGYPHDGSNHWDSKICWGLRIICIIKNFATWFLRWEECESRCNCFSCSMMSKESQKCMYDTAGGSSKQPTDHRWETDIWGDKRGNASNKKTWQLRWPRPLVWVQCLTPGSC